MNLNELFENLRTENPCWKGYHPVGTKKKNGRTVPNCVPNANEDVAESSVDQLPTQGADYSKHSTAELKMMLRPGILHRNEARFKSLIRKELQKREQQGVAEGARELTNTPRDRFISRMSPSIDHKALMQKVVKVVNSPEFTEDTILQIVGAGDNITHPVGRYIQQEFNELQYDLGRKYEDYPDQVAQILLSSLRKIPKQGVAEGEGGFDIDDMVMDQYRNGNDVWEIAQYLGIGEDEVQDIIDSNEQGVAEGEYKSRHIHRQEQNKKYDEYRRNQEAQGKKPLSRGDWAATQRKGQQGLPEGEVDEADNEKIGHMDTNKFDDAMARLKKLAGAGPMKTVYDPNTRRYKNVPVAQQPGDKK